LLHHLVKSCPFLYIIVSEADFRLKFLVRRVKGGETMGFLKRLLGLETKPGEPETLDDRVFDDAIDEPDIPVFIFFFNLWCSGCQVMHGLLNEIGPDYIGRARFYKMDVNKSPHAVTALGIRGVPVLAVFSPGGRSDSTAGLLNITELREWIESRISGGEAASGTDMPESDQDRG
jgi:thiol-disulfide isomerase/thioredoxin